MLSAFRVANHSLSCDAWAQWTGSLDGPGANGKRNNLRAQVPFGLWRRAEKSPRRLPKNAKELPFISPCALSVLCSAGGTYATSGGKATTFKHHFAAAAGGLDVEISGWEALGQLGRCCLQHATARPDRAR